MVPPAIFLAITWYFGFNALHGARGLEAQAIERAQLVKAQQNFAVVDAARAQWETRVSDPADLVVKLGAQPAK